eukprot:TRINITY_DN35747_c0_g1_i3.p1 TRINITY_DN35747_c0_g1~~TRINITY_DN35747_c0_g1_i3.p1  ORF type:complete len:587 (-),score=60.31 TRINITY_DN35747_c0_g1_i3:78-1838(-)
MASVQRQKSPYGQRLTLQAPPQSLPLASAVVRQVSPGRIPVVQSSSFTLAGQLAAPDAASRGRSPPTSPRGTRSTMSWADVMRGHSPGRLQGDVSPPMPSLQLGGPQIVPGSPRAQSFPQPLPGSPRAMALASFSQPQPASFSQPQPGSPRAVALASFSHPLPAAVVATVSPPGSPKASLGGQSPRSPGGRAIAKDPLEMKRRAAARLQAMQSCHREDTGLPLGGFAELPATMRQSPAAPPGAGFRMSFSVAVPDTAGRTPAFPSSPRSPRAHSPSSPAYRSPSFDRGPPRAEEGPPTRTSRGGWASPVTVQYFPGESPMSEIMRLDGGLGMHVVVGEVVTGSKAWRAGVRPGHALVVLNGQTAFTRLPGWQVRMLLEPPITIGFDPAPRPTVGMPPSVELRLAPSHQHRPLGLPKNSDILSAKYGPKDGDNWMLAEEISFRPSDDYLSDRNNSLFGCWRQEDGSFVEHRHGALAPSPSYELRRRQDQSPLRWLAPMFGHIMGAVCNDDSDEPMETPRKPSKGRGIDMAPDLTTAVRHLPSATAAPSPAFSPRGPPRGARSLSPHIRESPHMRSGDMGFPYRQRSK